MILIASDKKNCSKLKHSNDNGLNIISEFKTESLNMNPNEYIVKFRIDFLNFVPNC